MNTINLSPAAVVQRQLDAYNAKDIATLLAIYADDAELYEHPSTLLAKGSAALRERFVVRFQEPNLHAALLNRIATASFVIDHERITRTFPEGPGTQELTMIYEVKAGRITRAWTIVGAKTVGAVGGEPEGPDLKCFPQPARAASTPLQPRPEPPLPLRIVPPLFLRALDPSSRFALPPFTGPIPTPN